MRIVASGAVALRSGMLNFRLLDFLGLLRVAGHTNGADFFFVQDDLAIFWSRVAGCAGSFGKRRMRVNLHQLRRARLMRIVTLYAVGGGEGLSLVRLDQVG